MTNFRVFLASGKDVRADCDQIEKFLGQPHKQWVEKHVQIKVARWERLDLSFSRHQKQDEIDKELLASDLVVILVGKRIGPNTMREFRRGCSAVKEGRSRPKLYVLFKDQDVSTAKLADADDEWTKVVKLRKRIEELGQIYNYYKTPKQLTSFIEGQIDLLAADKWLGAERWPAPNRPRPFVNRIEEARHIQGDLKAGQVVHIKGAVGVGKTDLATVVARKLAPVFENHVPFFLDFDNHSLQDVLNWILSYSGKERGMQGQNREKLLLARQICLQENQRFLIVLDNVANKQRGDVEKLLAIRGQMPVLLTSRNAEALSFRNEKPYQLPNLSAKDSIRLLQKRSRYTFSAKEFQKLITIAPPIPFILTCAADFIKAGGRDRQRMLNLLAEAPSLLDEHDPRIREIFDYSYRHLRKSKKEEFLAAILTFGSDSFSSEALAAIARRKNVAADLFRLEPEWVKPHPLPGRYSMPRLARVCAERLVPERLRTAASRNMVCYFVDLVERHRELGGTEALKTEKANLMAAAECAHALEDYRSIVRLVSGLNGHDAYSGFFGRHGFWHEGIETTSLAMTAARSLGDRQAESCFRRDIAQFHYWLGENGPARQSCEESLRILKGKHQRIARIRIQHVLGYITDDEGEYERARALYEQALEEARRDGDEELMVLGYHLVGVIDYHQQRYASARRNLEESLKRVARLVGSAATESERHNYLADQARCERRVAALGRIQAHYAKGSDRDRFLREAMMHVECALAGEPSERGRARGLRQKGMILQEMGRASDAEECYLASLAAFERLGNLKGNGAVKFNLGHLAESRRDLSKAEGFFSESFLIAKEVNCPFGIALIQWHRGNIARKRGREYKCAARTLYQAAFDSLRGNQPLYAQEVKKLLSDVDGI